MVGKAMKYSLECTSIKRLVLMGKAREASRISNIKSLVRCRKAKK